MGSEKVNDRRLHVHLLGESAHLLFSTEHPALRIGARHHAAHAHARQQQRCASAMHNNIDDDDNDNGGDNGGDNCDD